MHKQQGVTHPLLHVRESASSELGHLPSIAALSSTLAHSSGPQWLEESAHRSLGEEREDNVFKALAHKPQGEERKDVTFSASW